MDEERSLDMKYKNQGRLVYLVRNPGSLIASLPPNRSIAWIGQVRNEPTSASPWYIIVTPTPTRVSSIVVGLQVLPVSRHQGRTLDLLFQKNFAFILNTLLYIKIIPYANDVSRLATKSPTAIVSKNLHRDRSYWPGRVESSSSL